MKRILKRNCLSASALCIAFLLLISPAGSAGELVGKPTAPMSDGALIAAVSPDFEGMETLAIEAPAEEAQAELNIRVGAGIAGIPDYEGSSDYEAVPLLFAKATWSSGRYLEFLGNKLSYNALASDTYKLGPLVRYRSERDDDVSNDVIARLEKVDSSVEVGAFFGMKLDNWDFNVNAAADIADGHDGSLASLAVGYTIPMQDLSMRLGVFTTYADDNYMESYFEINAADSARSGLPVYDASGGFKDFGAMVTVDYSPWEKWGVMGILGYLRLTGDAKDSPIVDIEGDANQYFGGVMATYNF